MAVFLSSFVNKIDKKGRVSVPAPFRAALGSDAAGIVVFRSLHHEALEGCSIAHLELLSQSLEKQNLPSDVYELIETTIFGGASQIPFDSEGRVSLPQALIARVGIVEEVAFVGRRKTFQIWDPTKLAHHEDQNAHQGQSTGYIAQQNYCDCYCQRRDLMKAAVVHIPVMVNEVVEALSPRAQGIYVDGTFGRGGYSRALLAIPKTQVVAIDRDPDAIKDGQQMVSEFDKRLTLIQGPFGAMDILLIGQHIAHVDGVTLDLGVSSPQIDDASRGFSFSSDGPLDMRMSRSGPSAADVVNEMNEEALANLIFTLGEERFSRRVAKSIVESREQEPITRTSQLADIIRKAVPRSGDGLDPATRSFQALRIHVNDELGELTRALQAAEILLKPEGRLAIVSFHSLEDRVVKEFLRRRSGAGASVSRHRPANDHDVMEPSFQILTKKPQTPLDTEIAANPRARSAKLRVAVRTTAPAQKEYAA